MVEANSFEEHVLESEDTSEALVGLIVLDTINTSVDRIIYHLNLLAYVATPEERRYVDETVRRLENDNP